MLSPLYLVDLHVIKFTDERRHKLCQYLKENTAKAVLEEKEIVTTLEK